LQTIKIFVFFKLARSTLSYQTTVRFKDKFGFSEHQERTLLPSFYFKSADINYFNMTYVIFEIHKAFISSGHFFQTVSKLFQLNRPFTFDWSNAGPTPKEAR
jgi:hypothetical protein